MTGWRKGFADVVAAIRGTLADAVNAGSTSAADFTKLGLYPGVPRLTGATGAMGFWQSPLIDLTAAPAVYAAVIPAAPAGMVFMPNRISFIVVSKTGTLSTQPTVKIGNDGARTNIVNSINLPGTAAINLGAGGTQQVVSGATIPYTGSATDLEVTVSATGTGGFSLTGYYQLAGNFMNFT